LLAGGAANLQIISDFDRTLTKSIVNGIPIDTTYGIIEKSELLSDSYRTELRNLYNLYHAIETDPHMSIEEKTPHMVKWWTLANACFVAEKISTRLFPHMISKSNIAFREKVLEFFHLAHSSNVPLLIFSAGIADVIEGVTEYFLGRTFKNIHVVGNHVVADKDDTVIGFREPLIHVFNKNETALSHDSSASWFESVKHRRNVILLGDSTGDVGMSKGVKDPAVLLNIGFLNSRVDENLPTYKTLFDVLILNDGTFEFPFQLLQEILK